METAAAEPLATSTLMGTMMDVPLTIPWILEHAIRNHGGREIVSREDDGSLFRYTFREFGERCARLAHALVAMGVRPGDRVASFGWNTHRHLELYFAVPSIGAVLHTVNIRLFPEQVCWALDHAGSKIVFVDGSLTPAFARAIATRERFDRPLVIMGTSQADLPNAADYEATLAGRPGAFDWPRLDERSAAILCYTSATTGDPKGVAFSHRSTVIHALASALPDALDIKTRDTMMPVVPMFHVNAWGLPFTGPMTGAKIVMPGSRLDAASLIDLIEREEVTLSAGVPTVWLALRDALKARQAAPPSLKRIVVGGSAMPPSLFDDLEALGITVVHAWGMTEMSPIGTVAAVKGELTAASPERRREALLKQGLFTPIVAWKVIDADGNHVALDGTSRGVLWVRGQAVTAGYFKGDPDDPAFAGGWFSTGDICTVDELGYLNVVDRAKDLVKSGGEWISSVELENLLMGHPAVKEAAIIGVPHEKWMERPVACVVLREGQTADEASLQAWLGERVAKWMIPDKVVFIDALPRTGVGKFLKRELRDRYRDLLSRPEHHV